MRCIKKTTTTQTLGKVGSQKTSLSLGSLGLGRFF